MITLLLSLLLVLLPCSLLPTPALIPAVGSWLLWTMEPFAEVGKLAPPPRDNKRAAISSSQSP